MHAFAAIPDLVVRRRAALDRAALAVFFFYSLLTTRPAWYRVLAVLLLAETAWFKLLVWTDPRSFILGIVLALAFAALHRRVAT